MLLPFGLQFILMIILPSLVLCFDGLTAGAKSLRPPEGDFHLQIQRGSGEHRWK